VGELLTILGEALGGRPVLALAGALGWGLASLLLSPCHLASVPLLVGFVEGSRPGSTARALALSGSFGAGNLGAIALVAAATAGAGRMLGDLGVAGDLVLVAVLVVGGLALLDRLPFSWSPFAPRAGRFRGAWGALGLGGAFGLAVGPCTFAFLAPVVGVALGASADDPLFGAALVLVFGVGHVAVMVASGTLTGWLAGVLSWNERSSFGRRVRQVCGVLLLLAAAWQLAGMT
jgi:cytochrome c-type biogenesis protein